MKLEKGHNMKHVERESWNKNIYGLEMTLDLFDCHVTFSLMRNGFSLSH